MTVYSLFQPPLLLAVGLVVLVIGTPSHSETVMTEVEEDRFVCLACQARHFPAIYSSRRSLRLHIHHSKKPKCAQEWSKRKNMTRPGDVIAGGAGGMGPCPPPQHQPPADVAGGYTCVYNVYTIYIQCIHCVYSIYILCIYMVYT